jgi:2-polyprenyl-3-methyl-5-hydroxy-6-metoxy-1,4-benzoquinol methylase
LAARRYSVDIDLESANSSHALAVLDVRPGALVLDIGAADGSVARRLRERGCRVIAVEVDPQAASEAEQFCERVVVSDVEQLDFASEFDGLQFDAVLLLDVLEHLRDPPATLSKAAAWCKPAGHVIVSVPNVTHAALRLQLLSGRFHYTDTGLLDRTHLHFFDRPGLEHLVSQADLFVIDRMRTVMSVSETEIPIDPDEFPPEVLAIALGDADAETYQFVYVTSPTKTTAVDAGQPSLGEVLQRRAHESERLRAEAEEYAHALQTRVTELERAQERALELESELRVRMQELESTHNELEHAKRDIEVKDAQLVQLHAELAPLRTRLDRLEGVLGTARQGTVGRIGAATYRFPALHRVLKRTARRIGIAR